MGNTKEKIRNAIEEEMKVSGKHLPIIEADNLEDAVYKAYKASENGDIITLSPASTSFDMFKNFEERGLKFKEIVMDIK
jgi:UDP-N-acetylmuramoylalanine--D-glutamate ligase